MGVLEDKSRARLFYKYLSKVYDQVNPFVWTEEMRTEAIALLEIEAGDRVLDVGCGTGFGTEGLLEHTENVHGLDQSVHQLEQAWDKFGKHDPVSFYRGDAERLPFADDTFDVVWSSGSIEYWPNPVDADEMRSLGVEKVDFETLLDRADHVVSNAPLTDETRGLFDADAFEHMRDHATLVNTGRGGIVDEAALATALEAGEIGAAALDVMAEEPPEASPLFDREDAILTPHAGWYSEEARAELNATVADNVAAALAGETPPDRIDPDLDWV